MKDRVSAFAMPRALTRLRSFQFYQTLSQNSRDIRSKRTGDEATTEMERNKG